MFGLRAESPRPVRSRRVHARLLGVLCAGAAVAATLPVAVGSSPAAAAGLPAPAKRSTPAALGTFHPIDPVRVADTRSGLGGRRGAVGGGSKATFDVTAAVPATASSVVVNVTATRSGASGYLTVFRTGTPRPATSSLNFTRGASVADLVTLPARGGKIDVFVGSSAPVDILLDVAGWYDDRSPLSAPTEFGSRYLPLAQPQRLTDTTLAKGARLRIPVAGRAGVPRGATSVVVNVTMDRPSRASYVTLWPTAGSQPRVSTVNAAAGATRANLAVVKLAADGSLSAALNDGRSRTILDVVGAFVPAVNNDAGRLSTTSPTRILDTRPAKRIGGRATPLAAGETVSFPVAGRAGIPAEEVDAVAVTVTAIGATRSGHLTVWSAGKPVPATSTLNFARGVDTPNTAIVRLGAGKISIRSNVPGVHVAVDVAGWYAAGPAVASLAQPAVAPLPPGYTGVSTGVPQPPVGALRTEGRPTEATVRAAYAAATPVDLPARAAAAPAGAPAAGAPAATDGAVPLATSPLTGVPQPRFDRWTSGYLPSSLYTAQIGQLLFYDLDATGQFSQGPVLCSGSVVGRQTVLTAAHCIYNDDGTTWQYGVFIPGLQGAATDAALAAAWQVYGFQTDHVYDATPNRAEPGAPYFAGDYATLAMYPNDAGARLGDVIPPLPVAINAPTGTKISLGYPVSRGEFSKHCTVVDCYQWFCQSPTGGYLSHAPGWAEVGFGCPTGPGNSGGPILAAVNGVWSVVSVVSNGVFPNESCNPDVREDCSVSANLWGPSLNSWTVSLIAGTEAVVLPPPTVSAGS